MPISESQGRTLEIVERVASTFSLLGTAFIVTTFILDSNFRKPINRLVFFATWGNLLANVGTLISRSAIHMGSTSPLCQAQSFLIQWFMPADALWTFAMACNVYLSFFRHYDSSQLRRLEWTYFGACYGVPLIPALTFLFVSTPSRGKIYGDAVLWCWISPKWSVLRIAAFYGPVWIVILTTIVIYIRVGVVILKWRKKLISINESTSRDFAMKEFTPPAPPPPQGSEIRCEVTVTSQLHDTSDYYSKSQGPNSPRSTHIEETEVPDAIRERHSVITPSQPSFRGIQTTVAAARPPIRTLDANKATLSYCKTSLLFFFALLCTWVPSTINRVHALIKPDANIFGFDLASSIVLPLQGFWNFIIYVVTSFAACKAIFRRLRFESGLFPSRRQNNNPSHTHSNPRRTSSLTLSKHNRRNTLESDDTRAEIAIGFETKNRMVDHSYTNRSSTDDEILIQGGDAERGVGFDRR
ncbi:hypothetical protein PV10_01520 [Exophiala mesophila]|uniref:G-protein coupled receptors family 2 profile 2 domain-containing protein n=1 Tax=Exophiala mesophila TaxID=212818 RepID=A0A0D1ZV02_EXOME|nr:uncharacterized protein PV10_01520 [Exophiala mesophila]KIV97814.1 hypothetical protein PV10_01520 [Exophiala mesophila]